MVSARRVDELRSNTNLRTKPPDTSLNQVTRPQFLADLPHILRMITILEARVACDYEKGGEARKLSYDVLCNSIRKIGLFRVTAHILERQYRNGGLIQEW